MRIEAKSVGRTKIPKDQYVVLDHARLHGENFSRRKLMQFCTIGCRLEACHFDRARIDCAQFGSGKETSEFINCTFDGAQMEMGSGGLSRFVGCSFRDVDLRGWFCFAVELLDCTFSGRLRRSVFNGTPLEEQRALLGRDRNEIHGNDFSGMEFVDVGFRTGVDLRKQRLPSGPPYLYLEDATAAVGRAWSGIVGWDNLEMRRIALVFVKSLQEEINRGQEQMLLRADDYYSALPREAIDEVFSLLRGVV